MGDAQPGYDVCVEPSAFREALRTIGITAPEDICEIRIEVKSKLSRTGAGNASVVHCNDCKLDGRISKRGAQRPGMTHLAIIIVDPGSRAAGDPNHEGRIEYAWLLSAQKARDLRNKKGKTQYISVQQLQKESPSKIFLIADLLNRAADRKIGEVGAG